MQKLLLSFLLILGTSICSFGSEAPSHSLWTAILSTYVDAEGHVNYAGIKSEEDKLDEYLQVLSANHPTDEWSKNEQLAFWINAYNAFTVKLIVKNYPVETIKDLGGSIYKVNTPWDIKFIKIGEETYDLNNLEHGIIRKDFEEPRIHFAVNCASVSCPALRNEAYTADRLDEQLDDQAKNFINDKSKNQLTAKNARLSKIFSWFRGDFSKGESTVIKFINTYSDVKISEKTKISYVDYDWNLNE